MRIFIDNHCLIHAFINLFTISCIGPFWYTMNFQTYFPQYLSNPVCLFHWDFTMVDISSKLGCISLGFHHFSGFWSTMHHCHIFSLFLPQESSSFMNLPNVYFFKYSIWVSPSAAPSLESECVPQFADSQEFVLGVFCHLLHSWSICM